MKTAVFLFGCVVLFTHISNTVALDARPFSKLENMAKKQWGGWSGNKKILAPLFNEERDRLGTEFRKELLEYLDNDVERHYWVASFLTDETYLSGRPPLKDLALLVLHQAIILCSESEDEESRLKRLPILVNASILSQEIGLAKQAKAHKKEVNRLLKEDPDLRGSWPVTSPEQKKLYNSIP